MATYSKRKNKWRCQIRRKGVCKSATFYTKAEAREWAIMTEREIDTGKLARRSTATLADAFQRYGREVSPQKKGRRWEQIRLRKLERDSLADVRFCDLTPNDLMKWRDTRSGEVSAGTVNRELTLIRSVLNMARKVWGWTDDDPLKDIKRLPTPPHRDRRISDDEIQRICWALKFTGAVRNKSHEVAVLFLLAIETGMRLGEMCGIKPADLHARHVRLTGTKNKDRRDVPLSKEALKLFDLLPDKVFTINSGTASSLFLRARDRAGIFDLTFHDSRHEACTRLARKIDVLDLARMIGHRDLRSLLIYFNPTASEIADRLDAAAEPTSPLHPETSAETGPRIEPLSENPSCK